MDGPRIYTRLIRSLRGLARRRLVAVSVLARLLVFASGGMAAEPEQIPVDLELVLAADVSYSMDVEDQRVQRLGYVNALRDAEVIRAIQGGRLGRIAVTYVEWGGTAFQVAPWTIVDGADSAKRFASEISRQPLRHISYTSISNALAFARELIRSNHYKGARRVIDVSGDGPNNAGAPAPVARNAAVAEGIVIDGLPIMLGTSSAVIPDLDAYYEKCVIGGEGAFALKVTAIGQLAETIRRKLVIEITGSKLSNNRFAPLTLPAAFKPYNCFIGEELGRL